MQIGGFTMDPSPRIYGSETIQFWLANKILLYQDGGP